MMNYLVTKKESCVEIRSELIIYQIIKTKTNNLCLNSVVFSVDCTSRIISKDLRRIFWTCLEKKVVYLLSTVSSVQKFFLVVCLYSFASISSVSRDGASFFEIFGPTSFQALAYQFSYHLLSSFVVLSICFSSCSFWSFNDSSNNATWITHSLGLKEAKSL